MKERGAFGVGAGTLSADLVLGSCGTSNSPELGSPIGLIFSASSIVVEMENGKAT